MTISPRELEVARLVAEGLADKEIAAILMISVGTVKTHLDRIARKIGANPHRSRRTEITLYVERLEHPPKAKSAAAYSSGVAAA